LAHTQGTPLWHIKSISKKLESDIMSTNIEKQSLEAHVELCAERYEKLDNKLDAVERKVEKLEEHVIAIRESLAGSGDKQSKQLVAIGTAIISVLITGIITLTVHLLNK
jgi:predicted nuclease with TOPRIM domain